MMMKQISMVVLGAGLALSTPAFGLNPNIGVNSGQFTIGIVGYVPVICRTSVNTTMVTPQAGEVALGSLSEFCNNPNGYEVFADYSPNLAKASLLVDGKKLQLSSTGSTRVSKSNRAGIEMRNLALDLPRGVNTGSISFRIVAL